MLSVHAAVDLTQDTTPGIVHIDGVSRFSDRAELPETRNKGATQAGASCAWPRAGSTRRFSGCPARPLRVYPAVARGHRYLALVALRAPSATRNASARASACCKRAMNKLPPPVLRKPGEEQQWHGTMAGQTVGKIKDYEFVMSPSAICRVCDRKMVNLTCGCGPYPSCLSIRQVSVLNA